VPAVNEFLVTKTCIAALQFTGVCSKTVNQTDSVTAFRCRTLSIANHRTTRS